MHLAAQAVQGQAFVIESSEPNDSLSQATDTGLRPGDQRGVFLHGNNADGPYGVETGDESRDFDFFSFEAEKGQIAIVDLDAGVIGRGHDSIVGIYDEYRVSSGTQFRAR